MTAFCSHASALLGSRVMATSMISPTMKTSLVHHHCLKTVNCDWENGQSDLTDCMESCLQADVRQDALDIDVVFLDEAVVVNFL